MTRTGTFNFHLQPAASASSFIDLTDPRTEDDNGQSTKDFPDLRNITIYNAGTVDVQLFLNEASGFQLIPSGTIQTFEVDVLSKFKVKNTDGATAADTYCTVDNAPTVLSTLKAVLRR